MVRNADGDDVPLLTPACQGHRDHTGVGQPPPPMGPPMRHAGSLEVAEWETYYHHSVCQGGGTEETEAGGRGDAGERK